MNFNGVEYRDWRKIANAIKEGKDKSIISNMVDDDACILCDNFICWNGNYDERWDEETDYDCPLKDCCYVDSHWGLVIDYCIDENGVTKRQALKSVELIAEIIEGTVCI